ncbi:hypothetical protein FKM82_030944 [Ascaphus truei]
MPNLLGCVSSEMTCLSLLPLLPLLTVTQLPTCFSLTAPPSAPLVEARACSVSSKSLSRLPMSLNIASCLFRSAIFDSKETTRSHLSQRYAPWNSCSKCTYMWQDVHLVAFSILLILATMKFISTNSKL